jgi:hypothetical protein
LIIYAVNRIVIYNPDQQQVSALGIAIGTHIDLKYM